MIELIKREHRNAFACVFDSAVLKKYKAALSVCEVFAEMREYEKRPTAHAYESYCKCDYCDGLRPLLIESDKRLAELGEVLR